MVNPDLGEPDYKPMPTDDPKKRKPDITKATERLGWTPKVELDVGLEKTIADFRARLEKKGAIAKK